MEKQKIVALVVLDTDDPALLDRTLPRGTAGPHLRARVIEALPDLSRVMALMSEGEATLMLSAHAMAWDQAMDTLRMMAHPAVSKGVH